MGTTALHAIPYPTGGDPPAGMTQMQALAEAIDLRLPYVGTSAPPHYTGRIWTHPTSRLTQISDGSTWYPIAGSATAWTPVLASTGTAPTVGTGTKTGTYQRSGGLITASFRFDFAGSPSAGSGTYVVGLPMTASSGQVGGCVGSGLMAQNSPLGYFRFSVELFSTTQLALRYGDGTTSAWGATFPAAPANGDVVTGTVTYCAS